MNNYLEQWKKVASCNTPIVDLLHTLDGNNKTLLDMGCGSGILSDIALERGFKVTSVDIGNTPYKNNLKVDTKLLKGYWDFIISSGFPPGQLPTEVSCKYFIHTTSRKDFENLYDGDLFFFDNTYIRTNITPLPSWRTLTNKTVI